MGLLRWLNSIWGENQRPAVHIPDGPRTSPVRMRCRFSGIVQDVGFRYEAQVLAGQLGLTGWARNESDGTVTMELEGEERCIRELLRVMREVPRFDITAVQEENLPLSGAETAFEIRY